MDGFLHASRQKNFENDIKQYIFIIVLEHWQIKEQSKYTYCEQACREHWCLVNAYLFQQSKVTYNIFESYFTKSKEWFMKGIKTSAATIPEYTKDEEDYKIAKLIKP